MIQVIKPFTINDYKNENVISRFMDMYNIDLVESERLFEDTKRFMQISLIEGVFIPDDLLIIDEMWHNFILFTSSYKEYCFTFFDNKFLHHLPASKKEKEDHKQSIKENPKQAKEIYLQKLEKLITVVYDSYGEATVKRWFQEYPVKYSKQNIKILRK